MGAVRRCPLGKECINTMDKAILVYCLVLVGSGSCQEEAVKNKDFFTVHTFLGSVKGTREMTKSGTPFFKFEGIPYAEPPVGDLRLMPPQPVSAWGELTATSPGPKCPQFAFLGPDAGSLIGEEDCLSLNVYSPTISHSTNPYTLKPVMIWIHGGDFIFGSSKELGNEFTKFVEKDVVVVSINYRLGPLGFMTFGNRKVSGNMGLKDQNMAIRWVNNHIRHFGGNPDKITIFGESAGGISVHAHILSPQSSGLLAGGISQSGTMLFKNLKTQGPREERSARKVAERLECSSTNFDEEMLNCLQNVPLQDLLTKAQVPPSYTRENIVANPRLEWWPVVDSYAQDPFLPRRPLEALKTGEYNQIPYISGTNKEDGGVFVLFDVDKLDQVKQVWDLVGPPKLALSKGFNVSDISTEDVYLANIVKRYYTGEDFSLENLQNMMDMYTDAVFLSPDQKTVSLMALGTAPVYNYMLTYNGSFSVAQVLGGEQVQGLNFGVSHGDDVLYLFPENDWHSPSTEDEVKLSNLMITFWTNFAKFSNPTPFRTEDAPNWDRVIPKQKNCLELKPFPEMRQDIAAQRMEFWERLVWSKREDDINRNILLEDSKNILV